MKKLLVLLGGLALMGSLHAEVISFDFTAKIDQIQERGLYEYPGTSVQSSAKAGVTYSIGDIIHGRFQYDTNTGLGSYQPVQPGDGSYTLYDSGSTHNSLTAHTSGGVTLPPPYYPVLLQVSDTTTSDFFSVNSTAMSAQATQYSSVLFMDYNGSWLNNSALPSAAQLYAASYAMFNTTYYFNDDSGSLDVSASITSFSPASAVPEPSSYLMLLAGMAAIAVARRNRKLEA